MLFHCGQGPTDWTRALQILQNVDGFLKGPGKLRPGVILIGTPLMTMSKSAVCNMNEDFVAEHGSSACLLALDVGDEARP